MAQPIGITDEQIEEMKKLRSKGYTFADLAKKYNISITSVRYHLIPHYKNLIREYNKKDKKRPIYNSKYYKKKWKDEDYRKRTIEKIKMFQSQKKHKEEKRNEMYKMVALFLCFLMISIGLALMMWGWKNGLFN